MTDIEEKSTLYDTGALDEHSLSWSDIDRIHLEPETYEDFQKRASF